MVELEGRQPIIIIPPHLAWHLKGILENGNFWFKEVRQRVWRYKGIPGHDELHKWCGSTNTWQECVMTHTNCVDLLKLSKSAWDQELGKIECVFCIMRWCLSSLGFPIYILRVAQSVSDIPVSLYPPRRLPLTKLNGCGEKRIVLPQQPPGASQSCLNWPLQILLRLRSSTVCSQNDRMYI